MLRVRLWTGVCKTLMPDVVTPKAHQNDHSYFRFTTQEFSMVGGYTEDLKKPQKLSKLGGGCLPGTIWHL